MKLKMFELCTKTKFLSFEKAIEICKSMPAVQSFAGIVHDLDCLDDGTVKDEHLHIMCKLKDSKDTKHIAMAFGVDEQFVSKIKAPRFEQALPYLIHLNASEKHQYNASDIVSNFNYVGAIEKWKAEKNRASGRGLIDECIVNICDGKMTLTEAKDKLGEAVYIRNVRFFEKAYQEYLRKVPMPIIRQTFYVEAEGSNESLGKGGMGKTVATHALAKVLSREFGADITKDYDCLKNYIFDAGDPKVIVQNYKGQPILVLNEMTAYDLKRAFGGPRGVKELLETFPTRQDVNIKNSATVITAKYIIINGIQPFEVFKNELAGEYVDSYGHEYHSELGAREQYDRRFWVNIKIVDEAYMDILFNKGLFEDTKEYKQYIELKNIRVNWKKMIQRLSGAALSKIECQVFSPITDKLADYEKSKESKIVSVDEIPSEFSDYGTFDETREIVADGFEEADDDPFAFQNEAVQMELPF